MTRRWCVALLLLGLASMARAAMGVDELMAELAQNRGGRVTFVETRHFALLDKPLQASGEMVYTPPQRLEKRTLLPKPESMLLDGDRLTLERDKRRMTINLASRPEALAFVDSIRSTLAGNRLALEQHYRLEVEGERTRWTLTLVPQEPAIAGLLKRITISGIRSQVRHIEYLLVDGDRSEMSIAPADTP
jgi:hypothetical protein